MFNTLLIALGLMLVLEGFLPFFAPRIWRETFLRITQLADGQLRFMGLISMLIGLVVVIFAK
jgi:uncharacterized protein YjeT (DUF2065 family)